MYIRELTVEEFNNFKKSKPSSYHQTNEYAQIKCEENYEYELLGLIENGDIRAAFVFLVKLEKGFLSAYIPDGPLLNYKDNHLLEIFTSELIKYCKKEKINYVKINPNLLIGEKVNDSVKYNELQNIGLTLQNLGYAYLEEENDFEYVLPSVNAIINLDELDINNFSKNTKNKVRKSFRKGLEFEIGNEYNFDVLNKFIGKKRKKTEFYYNDYYNIFSKVNKSKLFLVKVDYEKFITNTKKVYDKELAKNETANMALQHNNSTKNINKKMNSDKVLLSYRNDISLATKNYAVSQSDYLAGGITIEDGDTAYILICGYDKNFKSFSANYFLYYEIMKYYQGKVKFLNIGGLTKNQNKSSKFHGIDEFKLGFNPKVVYYPGEFDLIINNRIYKKINKQK